MHCIKKSIWFSISSSVFFISSVVAFVHDKGISILVSFFLEENLILKLVICLFFRSENIETTSLIFLRVIFSIPN